MKFKEYNQNQILLLPPDIQEMIPANHIVRAINTVVEQLDMKKLYSGYSEEGQPAYHPKMLLKLLLYGYSTGVRSSRKIAQRTESDIFYMYLSGMQRPDFRTISDFRKLKMTYICQYFTEVVILCKKLGMIDFGHISIDGSKIRANASKHKTYKREDILQLESRIEDKIQKILTEAEDIDSEEDKRYGKEKRGDEIPEELTDGKKLIEKIRQAKKEIEEEKLKRINLTDSDSRLMKNSDGGYNMSYNAQLGVDSKNQIIISNDVVNRENDYYEFIPIYEKAVQNTQVRPVEVSADAGYSSGKTYKYVREKGIDAYIPFRRNMRTDKAGRGKGGKYGCEDFQYEVSNDRYKCPIGEFLYYKSKREFNGVKIKVYEGNQCGKCGSRPLCMSNLNANNRVMKVYETEDIKSEMRIKLNTAEGKKRYSKRLSTVEPVFAHIKGIMGFKQFLLRGTEKVKAEFNLICMAHNIKKLSLVL